MNQKGKQFISFFLIFSLLILPMTLIAKERRGADLVIQKTDGQQVKGELIAVKQNSLLLKESESGVDVSVSLSDTKIITINNKSQALEWGGIGFLIGGSMGATISCVVGTALLFYYPLESEESVVEEYYEYALPSALAGGVIGALIGVMTGASAGKDKTVQIEGKSDSEIKQTLEELRKKARVPNFQ